MPSIRSLLTGITLTTFTLLQYSSATPLLTPDCTQKTPTLPVNGGPTELPASSLTLAYVTIGRGIQNYSCTGAGALPAAIGAVATLYDATSLARRNINALHAIPPKAVYNPLPPPNRPLDAGRPAGRLHVIGQHYFDITGTPVFDLSSIRSRTILFAAKTLGIKAPANANAGPQGTGAVDWLALGAKSTYTSLGVKQVYRVVTAGGVGPICSGSKVESVQYAAEYWFFK